MANQPNNREKINDLREERNHIEGLLNQRFNFFVVIFGFIVAAIPYLKNLILLMMVFLMGTFIEFILALSIARAQRRLDISIEMLKEEGGITETIKQEADKGCRLIPGRRSVRRWIGYGIPFIITTILIISSIVLIFSIWNSCIYEWIYKEFLAVRVNN